RPRRAARHGRQLRRAEGVGHALGGVRALRAARPRRVRRAGGADPARARGGRRRRGVRARGRVSRRGGSSRARADRGGRGQARRAAGGRRALPAPRRPQAHRRRARRADPAGRPRAAARPHRRGDGAAGRVAVRRARAGVTVLDRVLRRAILSAADSPRLGRLVQRHGMRLGAARFVAGETVDEAVPVLRRLNERGLLTNTTILGEGITDEQQTRVVVDDYRMLLDRIAAERLRTNVALKLTHLGLALGEELAYANVRELVEHAASLRNFVRIDMEESAYVDATLRIYRRLRESGLANVGTVL